MTGKTFFRLLMCLILSTSAFAAFSQDGGDPVADKAAQVIAGKARFTVLTPRLIRMEWSEDGVFEDRASFGVVNRNLPVPSFKVKKSAKQTVITTSALTLTYKGNAEFSADNLSVIFQMADPKARKGTKKVSWKPGMDDSGNLLGTARTLDGFDFIDKKASGQYTKEPFDKGVVSRDGWAVIDESGRHLFEKTDSDWQFWVSVPKEGKHIDWYLFAYGHDYTAAVSDFTKISGKIPLPPKYALGYWWCRYWLYSDYELVDLAQHFRDFSIPADVMIIDMDWHDTFEMGASGRGYQRDASGERKGWTGYTWKKELFPNPGNLLQDLHNYGFKTSLNLHPASGLQVFEEPYERFVKDYLSRTGEDYDGPRGYKDADGNPVYVPFRMDQPAWADAYFNSVLDPMTRMGVDFWWLDWQQFMTSKYIPGLSNTFWLNHTFWWHQLRQSAKYGQDAARPMIYHRWGGIGSHRYQVGFSGDTYATWRVLSYLPWFTSTAANVGYGYWGHDIGGHMQPKGVRVTDPELYTRWLQGGVFTPIFKTHSTKDMSMEKRFWAFPDHFDPMREAVRLRYTLSPYIYGAARQAYDTGISICRPLYYYYPEEQKAYDTREEFFFGDDILATVLCEAADKTIGLTARVLWFPAGNDWYDASTGKMYAGGSETTAYYTIDENPYFVRAGAILPLASPEIKSLQESSNENWFMLVPGQGEGSTTLYEDDGVSQAYGSAFATTEVLRKVDENSISVTVKPRQGTYKGISATRKVRIVLDGATAPTKVSVNGRNVPYSRYAAKDAADGKEVWGYDGEDLAVVIYLTESSASGQLNVECDSHFAFTEGQKGVLRRMRRITPEAKSVFAAAISNHLQLTPELLRFAGTASYITENPCNAGTYLGDLSTEALKQDLSNHKLPEDFLKKLFAQISVWEKL
ncbi:MAG: DUF5110 domain-containing protein [Bacteroidales bacterium]|nr:DUF5110 domain-containing protein [Bacteroidales bacterium]